MLVHSFDRFYVVTKFMLPSIGDLKFSTLNCDNTCAYLDNRNMCDNESKKHTLDLMTFCKKIEPFVLFLQKIDNILQQYSSLHLRQGNKLDITPDSKETKMWNYHHTCIKFHRVSL